MTSPENPSTQALRELAGRNVAIVGGGGAVGREVARAAASRRARVLAIGRSPLPLRRLSSEVPEVQTLELDAARDDAAHTVFERMVPDVLVVCAGALPPTKPVHELDWQAFAANWDGDVRIAFGFVKEALCRPLPRGSCVILVSSGAAVGGSPISGGYAGAKRTQMFIANYAQKESDRLGLGLHFAVLAPMIMPESPLGQHAVEGYSQYLRISAADFIGAMASPPTPRDVATAALAVMADPQPYNGRSLIVDGAGMKPVG